MVNVPETALLDCWTTQVDGLGPRMVSAKAPVHVPAIEVALGDVTVPEPPPHPTARRLANAMAVRKEARHMWVLSYQVRR